MILTFILFSFFLNFFNLFFIKAEEIIDLSNNQIEKNRSKESSIKERSNIKKIHIVKVGDTITSISKLYSIGKDLLIELNDLADENYIYVGQTLKISDTYQISKNNEPQNTYHIVRKGENLTEISVMYGLDLKYLIEVNNLKDKDSLKVGSKLFLSNEKALNQKKIIIVQDDRVNKLVCENNKTYGPLTILKNQIQKTNNRKILNAINQNNNKIFISLRCFNLSNFRDLS